MRKLVTCTFIVASVLFAAPSNARMECYPGEIWMTKEGVRMCALASEQGACEWCEVSPTQP